MGICKLASGNQQQLNDKQVVQVVSVQFVSHLNKSAADAGAAQPSAAEATRAPHAGRESYAGARSILAAFVPRVSTIETRRVGDAGRLTRAHSPAAVGHSIQMPRRAHVGAVGRLGAAARARSGGALFLPAIRGHPATLDEEGAGIIPPILL